MAKTVGERLWSRVEQVASGCWEWQGAKRTNGYGSFAVKRDDGRWTYTTTHRAAYIDQVAPIPAGWEIDHLCKNRACVRPDHLEAVSIQENRRRRDQGYEVLIDYAHRPLPVYEVRAPASTPQGRAAWLCRNGHDTREVGRVPNGQRRDGRAAFTCAACRAEQAIARRKGGAHGAKTHCPKGHPYSDENTYRRTRPDGSVQRECRECVNSRNREARRRRAAARRAAIAC